MKSNDGLVKLNNGIIIQIENVRNKEPTNQIGEEIKIGISTLWHSAIQNEVASF